MWFSRNKTFTTRFGTRKIMKQITKEGNYRVNSLTRVSIYCRMFLNIPNIFEFIKVKKRTVTQRAWMLSISYINYNKESPL